MSDGNERRERLRRYALAPSGVPLSELDAYRICGQMTADIIAELESSAWDRKALADCRRELIAEASDSLENECLILRKVEQIDDELHLAMLFGRELSGRFGEILVTARELKLDLHEAESEIVSHQAGRPTHE